MCQHDGWKEGIPSNDMLSCWSSETYPGGCIVCVSVNVLKFVLCCVLLVFVILCESVCVFFVVRWSLKINQKF